MLLENACARSRNTRGRTGSFFVTHAIRNVNTQLGIEDAVLGEASVLLASDVVADHPSEHAVADVERLLDCRTPAGNRAGEVAAERGAGDWCVGQTIPVCENVKVSLYHAASHREGSTHQLIGFRATQLILTRT